MSQATAKIEEIRKPELVGLDKKEEEERATQLPVPRGWRILIAIPEVDETTVGGVIKADEVEKAEDMDK
jgi:hypothetical protein